MNPFCLQIVYKEPGKEAVVKEIDNSEAAMEDLVHGKIDSVGIDDGVCLIFNRLAETLKMPECCTIYNQTFYGPILIVEFDNNGQLHSLDEDNVEYYTGLI